MTRSVGVSDLELNTNHLQRSLTFSIIGDVLCECCHDVAMLAVAPAIGGVSVVIMWQGS